MGIIDTHAHLDDVLYEEDREELISSLTGLGVDAVVNVGATVKGGYDSLELSDKYPFIFAAVGVHPDEVYNMNEDVIKGFKEVADSEKLVAIGEIGLDYHNMGSDKETQHKWFRRQLELAVETELPVIIHSRDAEDDTFDVLKEYTGSLKSCVMHCYSYSLETALKFKELGCVFGIGGVVTFKNGKVLQEAVRGLELSDIVLETDCPYLAPVPHRGERNSSAYLPLIAEAVADIKGVSIDVLAEATSANAKKLFPRLSI